MQDLVGRRVRPPSFSDPSFSPSTGWPKPLHATDHSKAAPGISRLLQSVEYFPRAPDLRVDAETPGELFLPLLAKGFWTSYEQAVAVKPGTPIRSRRGPPRLSCQGPTSSAMSNASVGEFINLTTGLNW